eukprot:CAMPEP_0184314460 /NCGR_PEP_ID=MMETSP1049-20130417/74364_1 /TAXON_ID=77928 /ORGANISM="Proteomonas sulcata, Strain CCMP704" /LENGTH=43 /DNA_ID= /DNA_START= /DNA_END= /DNA_ORIENTATION=
MAISQQTKAELNRDLLLLVSTEPSTESKLLMVGGILRHLPYMG